MKAADIEVGRDYLVYPFGQGQFAPPPIRATVTAKAAGRVTVKTCEECRRYSWSKETFEVGSALELRSVAVARPWGREQDEMRREQAERRAQREAREARLIAAGVPDGFTVGPGWTKINNEALDALLTRALGEFGVGGEVTPDDR